MFDKPKLTYFGELKSGKPEINLHIDSLKNGTYVLNIISKEIIITTIEITKI